MPHRPGNSARLCCKGFLGYSCVRSGIRVKDEIADYKVVKLESVKTQTQ